ncbi:MAG TPA: four helix bundle protein [Pyrinomonadaceae bacterium]|nr:four helix bundle protein [Pyrinomonadaceae bacterium]
MSVAAQRIKIKSHRDLILWQKAMVLVSDVYHLTKTFPREEIYGLTAQTRRAAASVPANIAEGQGRRLGREFHQFLGNARGSLMELDTHLELALRVGYINVEQHTAIRAKLDEVGRVLNGLMRSITSDI